MRKVEVCCFNQEWASRFEEEANQLRCIFGAEILAIHHIGSTSIQGLRAKPVIDLMPVVKYINKIDAFNNEMKKIGYQPKGENGLPGRRYFEKGGDHRTHHVHFYEVENKEIMRHLAFRDYLRTHPDVKEDYGALKEKLSKQFPYDIDAYIKGKEAFVSAIEKKALNWYPYK